MRLAISLKDREFVHDVSVEDRAKLTPRAEASLVMHLRDCTALNGTKMVQTEPMMSISVRLRRLVLMSLIVSRDQSPVMV